MVYRVHQEAPLLYEAREIDHILDEFPIIGPHQLKHWEWIANYYMCPLGDVYRSAVPATLILESETILTLSENTDAELPALTDEEYLIYEALQRQPRLQMREIIQILNKKSVFGVIRQLLAKKIVEVSEQLNENYKPKLVRYAQLSARYNEGAGLQELLEQLKNADKQKALVLAYFQLANRGDLVTVKELLQQAEAGLAAFKALCDKAIFEEYYLREGRVRFTKQTTELPVLSDIQQAALDNIRQQFNNKEICLLFGVTSSGKTEIYIRLIAEAIAKGQQVLYLLPEIALTTQLVGRLVKYFGDKVTVFHSRYSNNERTEAWENVLQNKSNARIIIGARSALFLPFANLGLIVVDEEHEATFKQHDPAPRYHARDAATVLGKLWNAKILLGSATPSVETFYNVSQEKYGLVKLTERFRNILMPEIVVVDLKKKYERKQMAGHFSDTLSDAIRKTLVDKGQIILFQNRRGYAKMVECETCGHVPQCSHCDVSLTYHLTRNLLRCHYCGYAIAKPVRCHACGSAALNTKGFGTEQVQEELTMLFPQARVGRMDQDTTRGKSAFETLLYDFRRGDIDILVGTQMLAKGLDFENVRLVGIMNADNILFQPDFRAFERGYQLMAQVAGRSGRAGAQGTVIIQTFQPSHPVITQVAQNDYDGMYLDQIHEREQYRYPPFYRIIRLTLRHREFDKTRDSAVWLHSMLAQTLPMPVLGPEEPLISRIRNEYLRSIMIKIPGNLSLEGTKKTIRRTLDSFHAIPQFRSVKVTVNVDPY